MASEKKPSIYSDRSTIGSSSELDEYGVWVKSEPQDLSSLDAGGQGSDSAPSDFDTDFSITDTPAETESDDSVTDGLELPDLDIPDDSMNLDSAADDFSDFSSNSLDELDTAEFDDISLPPPDEANSFASSTETTETSSESSFEDSFTEVPLNDFIGEEPTEIASLSAASSDTGTQSDLSTQLLMKIANELSSIRNELSSLKAEFAGIKSAAAASEEKTDAAHSGFFTEEEDEKISLTGDELDNILNTADFTEESGADAGEASADMSIVDSGEGDDLSIDFASDDFSMTETEDSPLESTDSAVGDEPAGFEEETFDESHFGHIEIEEHKDSEELKHLREHGSLLTTSAPEDTSYLDEETLSVDFGTDEPQPSPEGEGSPLEETAVEDNLSLSDDLSMGDEISLDDDFSMDEPQPSPEGEGSPLEETAVEDNLSLSDDLSMGDEISLDDDFSMDEPQGEGSPLDDTPADEVSAESEMDTSLDVSAEDMSVDISADDISIDEPQPGMEDEGSSLDDTSSLTETPVEDELADDFGATEDFDDISLDLSDAVIDEPDLSGEITENPLSEPSIDALDLSADDLSVDDLSAEDLPVDDISAEPLSLDSDSAADSFSIDSDELSIEDTATEDVVIEDDNVMGDISDDAAAAAATDSLASESFEIELDDGDDMSLTDEPEPQSSLEGEDSPLDTSAIIPENFVESTDEASVPFDDDLDLGEAGAIDDLALSMDAFDSEIGEAESSEALDSNAAIEDTDVPAAAEGVDSDEAIDTTESTDEVADSDEAIDGIMDDANIPAGIRGELKTVLAYMDQLLEALPEEKIEEFAKSEYYDTYKKLFKELGLV